MKRVIMTALLLMSSVMIYAQEDPKQDIVTDPQSPVLTPPAKKDLQRDSEDKDQKLRTQKRGQRGTHLHRNRASNRSDRQMRDTLYSVPTENNNNNTRHPRQDSTRSATSNNLNL